MRQRATLKRRKYSETESTSRPIDTTEDYFDSKFDYRDESQYCINYLSGPLNTERGVNVVNLKALDLFRLDMFGTFTPRLSSRRPSSTIASTEELIQSPADLHKKR